MRDRSQKLTEMDDPQRREAILNALTHGSAASWQHVNLLGEYDFSEQIAARRLSADDVIAPETRVQCLRRSSH